MKMNFYLKIIVVCCIIVFSYACRKSDPTVFTQSDLPSLKVGNWWRYRLEDSTANTIDTLKLVVGSSTMSGSTLLYTCYIERAGVTIDSAHILLSDTSFEFNSSRLNSYMFQLPAKVNSKWNLDPTSLVDNYVEVLAYKRNYTVSSHTYGVFDLYRIQSFSDAFMEESFQISAGIGLVHANVALDNWTGFHRKKQYLIDYSLH
jgi:hypothetical protein